ncbi:threonine aldolase family protein [Culicoidibacter larvae]|uniref:Aminotransferase class I/II-fold pyridoxal phosphate-dependent enzyme n=1 Tax=Culicoidibacter larvae TaxID=2579976 RepID=A0A5R8QD51_9FIRM|nr:aminotransferase class I/II-fold pyridoxal phosphate-dependent enzyme [Culicoidibacter larvae]TLG74196.1 aminotransferase class I/II-fold pyridoxal phosphate-dependent enzyme [Culicoidibacter larvae]
MDNLSELKSSYQKTSYKLAQHGPRNVGILKTALENIDVSLESDMYGQGTIITDFQNKMADFFGYEAAVFFPSGTMAQQIALRIWCDRHNNNNVAYHPLSHLEIHEQDGLKVLQPIKPILLGEASRVTTLADIQNLPETVACVLLELPQREIGGQLPSFTELEAISAYCHERNIALHLDGARIWEITPYYQKSVKEIASLFDSVYASFYKGLGGIAGAILLGDSAFCEAAKIWKRRYGGDLISLYPYILAADYYFDKRINNMTTYYQTARKLAVAFNNCAGITTLPETPVSNMFHVHFALPAETVAPLLKELQEKSNIGISGYLVSTKTGCGFELSVGDAVAAIPEAELTQLFNELNTQLQSHI